MTNANESDFEIIEMENDKDHINLLIKSEPKYSTLAIVRRLKQETTIIMENTKNVYKQALLERAHPME